MIIGIVIVINMFFNYAISLVYTEPQYDNYCKQTQVIAEVITQEACVSQGGQWNANDAYSKPVAVGESTVIRGSCNLQYTCNNEYQAISKVYNRNIFVALVVLGVILVALSFVLAFNWTISVAFALGGILSIIIASMRYWGDADNLVRVVILFLALCALIYFALKKFKN